MRSIDGGFKISGCYRHDKWTSQENQVEIPTYRCLEVLDQVTDGLEFGTEVTPLGDANGQVIAQRGDRILEALSILREQKGAMLLETLDHLDRPSATQTCTQP